MAPNALLEKIKKNSTIKTTASIMESKVWGKKDMVPTDVPMVNLALSCDFDGGIMPGHLQIAGPSKHFKSGFMLLLGSAFLKKYEDGVVLFYDSEFGTPESYFDAVEMDKSRVVHTPITNVEELKFDLANQLKNINKGDHIMILVDSLGNLASLKEVEDAENEKSVADMTRAKALKSLFRIITPHLNLKDIPMVSINHTYKEIGLFPKDIVGGGTGSYYSSNDIWIVGRQQDKDGTELTGFNFTINIEKSRTVREKSKFDITVNFDGFIDKYSGLFELAKELGIITQSGKGWYQVQGYEKQAQKSAIEADTSLWERLLKDKDFRASVYKKYSFQPGVVQHDEPTT